MNDLRVLHAENGGLVEKFDGSLSDFLALGSKELKSIEVDDIYVYEIANSIDPRQIASALIFVGNESSDPYRADLESFEAFSPGDFVEIPNTVRRNVSIVNQEKAHYEILGIYNHGDLKLIPVRANYECSSLEDWFGRENLVIYNSWFSEGPGPISWEGESALFQIDEYILQATRGDSLEELELIQISDSNQLLDYIIQWLTDHGILVLFILLHATPLWEDSKALRAFAEAMEWIGQREAITANLNREQISQLLEKIRQSETLADAGLIQILENKKNPEAKHLIDYLESMAKEDSRDNLFSFGDFLERF